MLPVESPAEDMWLLPALTETPTWGITGH